MTSGEGYVKADIAARKEAAELLRDCAMVFVFFLNRPDGPEAPRLRAAADAIDPARAATDTARKQVCSNQMPSGRPACQALPLDGCSCNEAQRDAGGREA